MYNIINLKIALSILFLLICFFPTHKSYGQEARVQNIEETRDKLKQAKLHFFKEGHTRRFEQTFQHFIDSYADPEIRQIDEKHYANEKSHSYNAKDHLYSWIDVNNDGQLDVIMRFQHRAYCGTVGCRGFLFLSTQDELTYLNSLILHGESFKTILLTTNDTFLSIFSENECLLWDGKEYKTQYGYPTQSDGEDDWNPHACGSHH